MPSRLHREKHRKVYLDQAAWSHAFRGKYGDARERAASSAVRPLCDWLESDPRGVDLCLSLTHLTELSLWDEGSRRAMASWLDTLAIVWVRNSHHVMLDEVDACLRTKVSAPRLAVSPWASCLTACCEGASPDQVGAILSRSNVSTFVEGLTHVSPDRGRAMMPAAAQMLRENAQWADDNGWTDQQKKESLDTKRREGIAEAVQKVLQRWERDPELRHLVGDAASLGHAAGDAYVADPTLLPCQWLMDAYNRNFASIARREPLNGKKLESAAYDALHATVGGAHADLFTCDKATLARIRGARPRLGRAEAIVSRPTADFADAVMRGAAS